MPEYIEKEAVCEDAKTWFQTSDMKLYNDCVQMVRDRVTALPAADVRENVTGEWMPFFGEDADTGELTEYGYECSICGRWEAYKEPFCNCGADMRGGNDG